MDIKAMAKSKRSHTQQNQKHPKKPQQTPNATNKQVRDRNKGPPPHSLPSNLGRYQDDDGDDDDDVDVVKRKSKGADYTTLIAQAKDSRSSFHNNLPDFYQGAAPMLAFRGQTIYLQDRDDDFLMEDKASASQEIPFLSLDLKDLAERLSKVDLAKRLFVEPDLFPSEVQDQDEDENNAANLVDSPQRHKLERIDSFGELLTLYLEEEQMAEMQDDMDKDLRSHHIPEPTETKVNDLGKSALPKSESLDKDTMPDVSHVHEHDARPSSRFDTASAEAELDMLLGSFNETQIFDTPTNQLGSSSSYTGTYEASLKHPMGQFTPGFPVTSGLDDELDDLLAETLNLNNDKHSVSQPMTQLPSSSLSQPNSKAKDLEDFDSWMDTLS